MTKKIIINFTAGFLFCFVSSTSFSQASGYLGNKFSINIGSSFYYAVAGPTKGLKGENAEKFNPTNGERNIGLNYSNEIAAEYALFRYGSIGLYHARYKTAMITDQNIFVNEFIVNSYLTLHNLSASTLGIYYSRFKVKKGALAPLGRYSSYGLETVNVTGTVADSLLLFQGTVDQFNTNEVGELVQEKRLYNFVGKYMISIPLTDHLLLRAGGSLRLPIGGLRNVLDFLEFSTSTSVNLNQDNFDRAARQRISYHGIVRFEIGLGYLLF